MYYIHAQAGPETRFACSVNNFDNIFLSASRNNLCEFQTREGAEFAVEILKEMNPDYEYSVLELT